jgi:HJR/Mrr/RecB family endonuclease
MNPRFRPFSGRRQAGRQYEDYIAKLLREDGWEVVDNGLNGVNDHGIDLIASKDGTTRYVQCKGYSWNKLIHEDVVSHLYGSVAAIEGPDNLSGVEIYLYSPAQLDEYTKREVETLNIQFVRQDFPSSHYKYHPQYHIQKRFHKYRAR